MILLGTIINSLSIVIGASIGRLFHNIPEKMKETVMSIIGLAVAVLGIQMGFASDNFIVIIISLVVGTVIGEWIDLDQKFHNGGKRLEKLFGGKGNSSLAEGLVTATLIYVIGSMAILGAIDSGLRNDHSILITKGIIDGFTAIILASTLGVGVLFAAIPVFIYQGTIALGASAISQYIPQALLDSFIQEVTAVGGVMIFAIGLNIVGITKIRAANLLPSILCVVVLVVLMFLCS